MYLVSGTIIQNTGHLVYQSNGKIRIGFDEHGCPQTQFSSSDIKEVKPYNGQDPNDLKKLIGKLTAYMKTGFNSQVKLFSVYKKDNKLIREVTTKQLQDMCNQVFGKQYAPKVPDFTNYYNPKKEK